jgi:hypothetical protein
MAAIADVLLCPTENLGLYGHGFPALFAEWIHDVPDFDFLLGCLAAGGKTGTSGD